MTKDTLNFTLFLFIAAGLVGFILGWSAKNEKAVMSVKYCFQERADGSIYHYVCEK